MRQYTNESQTTKLIELGFVKPKSISSIKVTGDIITTAEDLIGEPSSVMGGNITANYSIGELIEMLGYDLYSMHYLGTSWEVKGEQVAIINENLIDALYDMCIKLKEEGVI